MMITTKVSDQKESEREVFKTKKMSQRTNAFTDPTLVFKKYYHRNEYRGRGIYNIAISTNTKVCKECSISILGTGTDGWIGTHGEDRDRF